MWGNILTEVSYMQNFNMGFSNNKSDVLIHLTQWQYWWWFWFAFLWVMYYLLVARVFRFRTLKFNPRIASTLRPHGKWGDLLACIIPTTWCMNILLNSNFILKLIEWQSESSLFTLRVRAKQWYWIYKLDLRNISDIFSTPRNIGRNKWQFSTFGDLQTAEDYLHILQMRAYNDWSKNFWVDLNKKALKQSKFTTNSPIDNYRDEFNDNSELTLIFNKTSQSNFNFSKFFKNKVVFTKNVDSTKFHFRPMINAAAIRKSKGVYTNYDSNTFLNLKVFDFGIFKVRLKQNYRQEVFDKIAKIQKHNMRKQVVAFLTNLDNKRILTLKKLIKDNKPCLRNLDLLKPRPILTLNTATLIKNNKVGHLCINMNTIANLKILGSSAFKVDSKRNYNIKISKNAVNTQKHNINTNTQLDTFLVNFGSKIKLIAGNSKPFQKDLDSITFRSAPTLNIVTTKNKKGMYLYTNKENVFYKKEKGLDFSKFLEKWVTNKQLDVFSKKLPQYINYTDLDIVSTIPSKYTIKSFNLINLLTGTDNYNQKGLNTIRRFQKQPLEKSTKASFSLRGLPLSIVSADLDKRIAQTSNYNNYSKINFIVFKKKPLQYINHTYLGRVTTIPFKNINSSLKIKNLDLINLLKGTDNYNQKNLDFFKKFQKQPLKKPIQTSFSLRKLLLPIAPVDLDKRTTQISNYNNYSETNFLLNKKKPNVILDQIPTIAPTKLLQKIDFVRCAKKITSKKTEKSSSTQFTTQNPNKLPTSFYLSVFDSKGLNNYSFKNLNFMRELKITTKTASSTVLKLHVYDGCTVKINNFYPVSGSYKNNTQKYFNLNLLRPSPFLTSASMFKNSDDSAITHFKSTGDVFTGIKKLQQLHTKKSTTPIDINSKYSVLLNTNSYNNYIRYMNLKPASPLDIKSLVRSNNDAFLNCDNTHTQTVTNRDNLIRTLAKQKRPRKKIYANGKIQKQPTNIVKFDFFKNLSTYSKLNNHNNEDEWGVVTSHTTTQAGLLAPLNSLKTNSDVFLNKSIVPKNKNVRMSARSLKKTIFKKIQPLNKTSRAERRDVNRIDLSTRLLDFTTNEGINRFFKKSVLNNCLRQKHLVIHPDLDDETRILKKNSGKNTPIRILKLPKSDFFFTNSGVADTELLRFRFNEKTPTITNKPIRNTVYLTFKQKRYNQRVHITKKNVTFRNRQYSGNPFLKNLSVIEENFGTPTRQYRMVKKAKARLETTKVGNWNRLLRSRRVLVLPAHVNITVITNSFDVVHSWHIPGLGLKMDCLPGRATHHTLYIDNVGLYYGQCAEICGRYHHHMPIRICALPFEHFLVWWHTFGLPKFLFQSNKNKSVILANKYFNRKFSW